MITLVYYTPGAIVDEDFYMEVDEINPEKHAKELPKGAFMFNYLYKREGKIDGIEYCSIRKESTQRFHIDAKLLDKLQVKMLNIDGRYDILLSNMKHNDYKLVIKERTGNVKPYDYKKDAFITT